MDKKKQAAITKLKTAMVDYNMRCAETIRLVESLPDNLPGELDASAWQVDIDVPYDIHLVRQVRQLLAPDWKPQDKRWANVDQDTGLLFLRLRKNSSNLRIIAHTSKKGALCRLEKIGTETVERPIYKIVCDKENNENKMPDSV